MTAIGQRMLAAWPFLAADGTLEALSGLAAAGGFWTVTVADTSPSPWGQPWHPAPGDPARPPPGDRVDARQDPARAAALGAAASLRRAAATRSVGI